MIRLAIVGQVHLRGVNVAWHQGRVAHSIWWWWTGLMCGAMMSNMISALDLSTDDGTLNVDNWMHGQWNTAHIDWGHV